MDINLARSVVTVLLLAVFIGIVLWAYSGKRKQAFDAAARLPLDEEAGPAPFVGSDRPGASQ
jgi:cytochrome c oxidase cbb3-type subunit 4